MIKLRISSFRTRVAFTIEDTSGEILRIKKAYSSKNPIAQMQKLNECIKWIRENSQDENKEKYIKQNMKQWKNLITKGKK